MGTKSYQPQKSYRRYTEAFKHKVCEDYMRSDLSANYFRIKYGIKSGKSIKQWLRKFGMERADAQHLKDPVMAKEPTSEQMLQLQRRVKELERCLEDANLKAELYQTMIRIAEKELGINIEKKAATKQSK